MKKLLLALFSIAAASIAIHAQTPATVFENGRVIVGDGRVIENTSVVVEGGRITQVGATVKAPAGATRVSLAGKTLMPAIVDAHVHTGTTAAELETDLRRRAHYGIGAALSLGLDGTDAAFAQRTTTIPGLARIFTAGRGITAPEKGRTEVPFWITTPEEARKAVQENAAKKVDIIKIWVDDEAVALLKARPSFVLIPNMPDRGVAADYSWLRGSIPDAELQKIQAGATDRPQVAATCGIQGRNLKKMSDAGVKITVGTDGNTPWAAHVEMADMLAAGMTPGQVTTAATKNGVEFLRIANTGTIETGKVADLLVLDANPLADITNTRKISAVYLRGVAVNRTPH